MCPSERQRAPARPLSLRGGHPKATLRTETGGADVNGWRQNRCGRAITESTANAQNTTAR